MLENTKLTEIKAIDLDSDSNLKYFLIKTDQVTNGTLSEFKMEAYDERNHLIDFDLVKVHLNFFY